MRDEAPVGGRLQVGEIVLDVERLGGMQAEGLHEQLEEGGIGLGQAHLAETRGPRRTNRGTRSGPWPGSSCRRPSSSRRRAVRPCLGDPPAAPPFSRRPRRTSRRNARPTPAPRAPIGVGGGERRDRVLVRGPEIVLGVPLRGAHLGQETFHGRFVGDHGAIEVARVPVDEDAADVEDHGPDRGARHRPQRRSPGPAPGPVDPASRPIERNLQAALQVRIRRSWASTSGVDGSRRSTRRQEHREQQRWRQCAA